MELEVGENVITVTVTPADKTSATNVYEVVVTRRTPSSTIAGTVTDADGVGISGVTITVDDDAPLNATGSGATKALKTASDGTYSAEVESQSDNVLVKASKAGYTFSPAERWVSPVANATITGIDFTAATNVTIKGSVMKVGGGPLAGVAMTVSTRRPDVVVGTATTSSTGAYTIRNVPTGSIVVRGKLAGYMIYDETVQISGGSGGTIEIETMYAHGTIQPTNVEAVRATDATTGAFNGTVDITWEPGEYDGVELVTYTPQTCFVTEETSPGDGDAEMCEEDGVWTSANAGFSPYMLTNSSDGAFKVRVQATATIDSDAVIFNSAVVDVAAIDVQPSALEAVRKIQGTHRIDVAWNGNRASNSQFRLVASFDEGTTWVVLVADNLTRAISATHNNQAPWTIVAVSNAQPQLNNCRRH